MFALCLPHLDHADPSRKSPLPRSSGSNQFLEVLMRYGQATCCHRGYRATEKSPRKRVGRVIIVYLEVMERPRAAPTAEETGVEDRVGAALRLCAMWALTR